MSRSEARARRRAAKKALREYLKGNRDEPLVLPIERGLCPCDALLVSFLSKMRSAYSYFVIRLACSAPMIAFGFLQRWLLRRTGVKVGRRVFISPRVSIDALHPGLIELGDDCILGEGCRIFAHEHTATSIRIGRVRIGEGAVIGAYSTVRSGVTVGRRATVGFMSFVNRDVPDGAVVGGVPARVLNERAGDPSQGEES